MNTHTCHPEQLNHVILAARQELKNLFRERTAIEEKVRIARRTVRGLEIVFCRAVNLPSLTDYEPLAPESHNGDSSGNDGILEAAKSDRSHRRYLSQRPKRSHPGSYSSCDQKLERACRIALLESEEPVTATQVYDRIMRRGSYRLERFRHPLRALISTLEQLVENHEVDLLVHGEVRSWAWVGGMIGPRAEEDFLPVRSSSDNERSLHSATT